MHVWGGIGFIEANGAFHRVPWGGSLTFPYWDPSAPNWILTLSSDFDPETRSYEIDGDSVDLVGSLADLGVHDERGRCPTARPSSTRPSIDRGIL